MENNSISIPSSAKSFWLFLEEKKERRLVFRGFTCLGSLKALFFQILGFGIGVVLICEEEDPFVPDFYRALNRNL